MVREGAQHVIGTPYPYPKMKDSGIPWLGEVPEHWTTARLKSSMNNIVEQTTERRGSDLYVALEHVESWTGRLRHAGLDISFDSQVKYFRSGDILFGKLRPYLAKVTRLASDGVCVGEFLVLRPRRPNATAPYMEQLLRSKPIIDAVSSSTFGAKMPRAGWQFMGGMAIVHPPLPEQAAIVRYLDHADRRIWRYIRAKQKLIKLLEEQKQVLIHRAVTGRVDVRTGRPYPAYKDSGVEWLGEVPQGWQRCRLRNIVSMVTTGSRGWASYASDTGPLFIRVANLSRGSLRLRFDDLVRLDLPITSEAGRTRIEAGDLLLSVTAYIGSVGVAPEGFEEAYVSQHVARCRPLPGMHARWLGYVLLSTVGQTHGQMSLYGGTKDGLSLDDVKNYPILLPPQHEQEQTVRWIEGGLSGLVKIGDGAKRQIELVREYRTRLVADVVTGKLDVREAAARLPEVDPHADEFDAPIQAAETGVMEVEDTESAEELAMESEATL